MTVECLTPILSRSRSIHLCSTPSVLMILADRYTAPPLLLAFSPMKLQYSIDAPTSRYMPAPSLARSCINCELCIIAKIPLTYTAPPWYLATLFMKVEQLMILTPSNTDTSSSGFWYNAAPLPMVAVLFTN